MKHYVFVGSAGAYAADSVEPMHVEGDKRKASAGALSSVLVEKCSAGGAACPQPAALPLLPVGRCNAWPLPQCSSLCWLLPLLFHLCRLLPRCWPGSTLLLVPLARPRGGGGLSGAAGPALHRLPAAVSAGWGLGATAHGGGRRQGAAALCLLSSALPALPWPRPMAPLLCHQEVHG